MMKKRKRRRQCGGVKSKVANRAVAGVAAHRSLKERRKRKSVAKAMKYGVQRNQDGNIMANQWRKLSENNEILK
jgi:hypothetical protein